MYPKIRATVAVTQLHLATDAEPTKIIHVMHICSMYSKYVGRVSSVGKWIIHSPINSQTASEWTNNMPHSHWVIYPPINCQTASEWTNHQSPVTQSLSYISTNQLSDCEWVNQSHATQSLSHISTNQHSDCEWVNQSPLSHQVSAWVSDTAYKNIDK